MLKNKYLLIILIRLFLGYIFFSAGLCKLTHGNFGQLIGPPWLEEALAKHGLGLFAQVVAVSQVICGTLLLSQRFSLLGAVMLVPMNVAILSVTVSMNWAGTPYVNTVFLGLNIILLVLEHQKFSFLFKQNKACTITPSVLDSVGQNMYSWIGVGFCTLALVMAFVSITFTNLFALLAFAGLAATIICSSHLTKIDTILIMLPFLGMIAVTYGNLHANMQMALLALISVEALLLFYRLYLGARTSASAEAPVTAAAG